jgi:hypothetical protein
MIAPEKNRRAAAVPGLVVVLVVILIVGRHPSDCRVAVVNRNYVAGQQVQGPRLSHR